jgi:hypothetical protein
MVSSAFVSDAEWGNYFNEALGAYWLIQSECAPADFAASESTYTTSTGVVQYALPADFRTALEVYADEGGGYRRPLLPTDGFSRAYFRAPQGAYSMILRYQANAPIISDDVTAIDLGELGDTYVVRHMAAAALAKEESDVSYVASEIEKLEARMRQTSQRDRSYAKKSRNIEATDVWVYPQQVRIRGYAIIGGNIEFYESALPLF